MASHIDGTPYFTCHKHVGSVIHIICSHGNQQIAHGFTQLLWFHISEAYHIVINMSFIKIICSHGNQLLETGYLKIVWIHSYTSLRIRCWRANHNDLDPCLKFHNFFTERPVFARHILLSQPRWENILSAPKMSKAKQWILFGEGQWAKAYLGFGLGGGGGGGILPPA